MALNAFVLTSQSLLCLVGRVRNSWNLDMGWGLAGTYTYNEGYNILGSILGSLYRMLHVVASISCSICFAIVGAIFHNPKP